MPVKHVSQIIAYSKLLTSFFTEWWPESEYPIYSFGKAERLKRPVKVEGRDAVCLRTVCHTNLVLINIAGVFHFSLLRELNFVG